MKKKGLLAIAIFVTIFIIGAYKLIISRSKGFGGMKINANPSANIFLDDKLIGNTPYEEKLSEGEYILKLIPSDASDQMVSWQGKVKVNPSVLTYINRELGPSELTSGGEILTLEKTNQSQSQLEITSQPDATAVLIDGQEKGITPLTVNVSEGEHDVAVSSPGFIGRTVRVQTTNMYKLSISFQLILTDSEKTSTASATTQSLGEVKTTPSKEGKFIKIKDTPTGFLRVRNGPKTTASEVGQIKPGEQFPLLDEQEGWYKINYAQGKEGWVSGRYAEIIE